MSHVVFDEIRNPVPTPVKRKKLTKQTNVSLRESAQNIRSPCNRSVDKVSFHEGKQVMQMAVDAQDETLFQTESSGETDNSFSESESDSEPQSLESEQSEAISQSTQDIQSQSKQLSDIDNKMQLCILDLHDKWKLVGYMVWLD